MAIILIAEVWPSGIKMVTWKVEAHMLNFSFYYNIN